jgi:serine protease Do
MIRYATAFLALLVFAPGSKAQDDIDLLEEQAFRAAVDRVAPSVVQIETLGGLERVGEVLVGSGPTTGLVVSEDGYVLSSAFNFIQQPTSILVMLPSGKRAAAEIVARDRSRMLVLLKVNTDEKLAVPEFVPREEMQVGQWTIAVGRTFQTEVPNVSTGILSAVNRVWGKAIQTDARVSPTNYGGPLVDIRGRVLGILVPLSPQQQGEEVAGAEWYDSGIGFAVPVAEILPHLESMKSGEDLSPGVLGVSLKGSDQFGDPALIGAVQPKSPAKEAGLEVGDEIVEADGHPIVRQVQLKHVIGAKYAGDTLKVVVKRGEEKIEAEATLVAELEPYVHPFLGILPMRDATEEKGIAMRFVYPASPAAEAGIETGDRITQLNGEELADAAALREKFASLEPEGKVKISFTRGGEAKEVEITLAKLPEEIPGELPAAHGEAEAPEEAPVTGAVEIKLPEEPNACLAYVPPTYNPRVPHGVVIWLHKPGAFDKDELIERWRELCETHDLIVLAPQSADPARWLPTEVEFIRKAYDDLAGKYTIDLQRVVVHGHEAGGAMAFLTAFAHRDVIRGVAAVDAAIPGRAAPPANDPLQRLAIYMTRAESGRLTERVDQNAEQLREMGYPVTLQDLGAQSRYLTADEIEQLARWVDSLDRL